MSYELLDKPKHGSIEWLKRRWRDDDGKCLFGASDIPVLMGVSPWRNRAELFLDKRQEPVVKEETMAMRRGNLLEPILLEEASRILKEEIVTPNFQFRKGRLMVSYDGLPANRIENPDFVVEAKTTSAHAVESALDLPAEWRWQGWAQSEVLGGVPVFFIVLDRRQNINLVELGDMPEARERLMSESEMFGSLIDSDAPLGSLIEELDAEQIASYFRATERSVELGSDAMTWIMALDTAREQKLMGEKMEKQAKDALARLLQDADVGCIDGVSVVSWKETAGRESLDAKALKASSPEIYQKYIKQGSPFRTMRLTKKGE